MKGEPNSMSTCSRRTSSAQALGTKCRIITKVAPLNMGASRLLLNPLP